MDGGCLDPRDSHEEKQQALFGTVKCSVAEMVYNQRTQSRTPDCKPVWTSDGRPAQTSAELFLAEVVLQHGLPFGVVAVVGNDGTRAADHLQSNLPASVKQINHAQSAEDSRQKTTWCDPQCTAASRENSPYGAGPRRN